MKYYLVEISDGDSKIKGKAVYEYEKLNDAVATFHTKLGSAMKSDLFTKETLMVIDDKCGIYESKCYEAPVPVVIPEPEVTPEEPTKEPEEEVVEPTEE